MKKYFLTVFTMIALCLAFPFTANAAYDDALSTEALVGRWGNSGVRYGFSDDGYFYKRTVISHTNMRSIYHSETRSYSGNYVYVTPGWWENTFYTTYTYLNTLFGRYRVKDGVIIFDDVITMPHSTFEPEWYRHKTRGPEYEWLPERFEKAEFSPDFKLEFEFITPTRVRFRDKSSDKDYFWELESSSHDVPVPTHEIPPVGWPAKAFSPEMPEMKTSGRLREVTISEKTSRAEEYKTTLVIDKTSSLADIRSYIQNLRGSGWWVEPPKDGAESLNLEARKGLWRLGIKSGNGPKSNEDTVVIESLSYPAGKWPETWGAASLEAPQKSVIVGNVDNKVNESDRNIREKLFFDGVDDKGVDDYADRLRQAGFKIPQNAGENWKLYKYIRVDGNLYRTEVSRAGRYDKITAFDYDFKYFADGVWPEVWRSGGLSAPERYDAIAGAIDMEKWDDKNLWRDTFSVNVCFLGPTEREIENYFGKLQASGFMRKSNYGRDSYINYLRLGGGLHRVEVEQRNNNELTEINYNFRYFEDGVWPEVWSSGGLSAPEGYETIAGAINMEKWDDKSIWRDYFTAEVKFLGLSESGINNYLSRLQASGFVRRDNYGTVTYVNYLRLGGALHRVQVEQKKNDEIAQINYRFDHIEDGAWPEAWSSGGLAAPAGYEAIAGAIDMKKWNDKGTWRDYYSIDIKFVRLTENGIKDYFSKLPASGFVRKDNYGTIIYVNYLRLGGALHRVQIQQKKNDEIAEITYRFDYIEDGVWPEAWREGGLTAPAGYTAIAGAIDMKKWNDKSAWRDYYSIEIKFVGLTESAVKDYFSKLPSSGFVRKDNYGTVIYVNYLRLGGALHRVQIQQKKNDEIAEINYRFDYIEDGVWSEVWREGGLTAPAGYTAIAGAIDIKKWNDKSAWRNYFTSEVKFVGLSDSGTEDYFSKLQDSGFVRKNDYGTIIYVNYLRLGGALHRVQVQQKKNDEISEISYRFDYIEDGVWPEAWREGGLTAPAGHTAIAGAIDIEKWDDKSAWRNYFTSEVKFVGLSDSGTEDYFSKLQTSGFVRKDNYGTMIYVNYLRLGGALHRVQIQQKKNDEISEISYRFEYIEDGVWPEAWREGGLTAPAGYTAIAGAIDIEKWNDKSAWRNSFSAEIKFVGVGESGIEGYFSKLQASGFKRKEQWGVMKYTDYLRLGGGLHRVQIERKKNDEITEVIYNFEHIKDGVWPEEWRSGGLIAPSGYKAIAGAIDIEKWRERIASRGSFSAEVKFAGLSDRDAEGYFRKLQALGFERRESWRVTYTNSLRMGGSLYRVEVVRNNNEEIVQIDYSFNYIE